MTTTHTESAAEKADRFLQAAQAGMESLREPNVQASDRAQLMLEIELALNASRIFSRLAVAQAIERSFPGLVAEPAEGRHRAEYTDDALPGPIEDYGIAPATYLDRYLNPADALRG